jgi:hypothetical protein
MTAQLRGSDCGAAGLDITVQLRGSDWGAVGLAMTVQLRGSDWGSWGFGAAAGRAILVEVLNWIRRKLDSLSWSKECRQDAGARSEKFMG